VILLAAAVSLFLRFTDPWDARHPRAEEVYLAVDAVSGQAWRVSTEPLDGWSRTVLTVDGRPVTRRALPGFQGPVVAAPAKPVAAASPTIALDKSADGLVTLRVTPAPGTTDLGLRLTTSTSLGDVALNGKPLAMLGKPGATTEIVWRGGAPLTLTFRPAGAGSLSLTYADFLAGWPAGASPLPPLPADAMGFDLSGSTVVVADRSLTW
jgi:hypothetical protein